MQHAFGFVAGLDQLALGKILLGEFDRFLEHAFDFGIVEPVGGLDFDRMLRAGAQIARILDETGFPAGHLEIELTEGVAINESGDAQETLEALQSLGVHLAIDDFGTGYSALSRLRSLPFDRLKVDKAFVDDIDLPHNGSLLVDTILEMAAVLHLEVVAEGIETATQAAYLRARGCDFAQGFLFSRPVDGAEMGALLQRQALEGLALPA